MQAVKLEDFLAAAEDVERVRNRLKSQRAKPLITNAPSPFQWKNMVEAWITSAATSERDVLGPFDFRETEAEHGFSWELTFDGHDRRLLIALVQEGDRLVLQFGDPVSDHWFEPALEISDDGPNIPANEIKVQLAEQLLLALDSLAPSSSAPDEHP